jgi:hypothetical protein
MSEYEVRSASYLQQAVVSETSPSDIASDMIVDSVSSSERKLSTSSQLVEKSQTSSVSMYLSALIVCSKSLQRRRAQNRAAQRAFRERKEKRAKDLEEQLSIMTEKYKDLETEHLNLQESYEKLQQTIDLLTSDEGRTSGEQFRRFIDIIQGKARTRMKKENL